MTSNVYPEAYLQQTPKELECVLKIVSRRTKTQAGHKKQTDKPNDENYSSGNGRTDHDGVSN